VTVEPVAAELSRLCTAWSEKNVVGSLPELVARRGRDDVSPPPGLRVDWVDDRGASLMVVRPLEDPAPGVLVFLHGGGYVVGSAANLDPVLASLVRRTGVPVVSVSYRLAPENPHPAALEDGLAAMEVVDGGRLRALGVGPGPTVLCGTSAGGGLALGVALHRRDAGDPALDALALYSPMLDDRTSIGSPDECVLPWNHTANRLAWGALLGGAAGGDQVESYAAPARAATYAGLPPTYLDVGTADLFHAENLRLARRMRADGVDLRFVEWPGGYHGFSATAPGSTLAGRCNVTRLDFLNRILRP
jgi:acetyl esterase/lipase